MYVRMYLNTYVHTFIVCILNSLYASLASAHVHMCVDDVHVDGCTVRTYVSDAFAHLLQVHAGIPRERTVTVQKEEQEVSEVAVSNDVEAPVVKVEKHRGGWLGRKSKKKVEVVSCSARPI